MKYRKLQIAWSVGCGILCLLLIALWVRSYWSIDFVTIGAPAPMAIQLSSIDGLLGANADAIRSAPWSLNSVSRDFTDFDTHRHGQFAFLREGGGWTIIAPNWFLIAMSIAAGSLPWLPCRFSLRTLLIGMTLMAAILGAVIYAAN